MSQINTNTIANELGTGGPDFVGMPSVGGDPVVESGSNTDGEWTRFSDGTSVLSCYINPGIFSITIAWEGNYYIDLSSPLPIPLVESASSAGPPYPDGVAAFKNTLIRKLAAGAVYFRVVHDEALLDRDENFKCIVVGRWK